MIKKVSYFFQSIIIYLIFLISKIIGLNLSRKIFSFIFVKIGNLFRSKKIIENNLDKIVPKFSLIEKENIINMMWSNYGKTFVEYVHLNSFSKKSNHINIKNKNLIEEIVKK